MEDDVTVGRTTNSFWRFPDGGTLSEFCGEGLLDGDGVSLFTVVASMILSVLSVGDWVTSTVVDCSMWRFLPMLGLFTRVRTDLRKLFGLTNGEENGLRRFSCRKGEEFSC